MSSLRATEQGRNLIHRHTTVTLTSDLYRLVVHRGANGLGVFDRPRDYRAYIRDLGHLRTHAHCALYAYCLLPDCVMLLSGASTPIPLVQRLMTRLCARSTWRRFGQCELPEYLWDKHVDCIPVFTHGAAREVCRWIELAPLRAGLVREPSAWPWSSFSRHHGLPRGWRSPWSQLIHRVTSIPLDYPGGARPLLAGEDYANWVKQGYSVRSEAILAAGQRAGLLAI